MSNTLLQHSKTQIFKFVFKYFLQYAGAPLLIYILKYDYVDIIMCETVHFVIIIVESVIGCSVVLVV